MTNKLKYAAEILDQSWWQEEVPIGFKDRTYLVYKDETEEGVETVYTWEEYLTQGSHQWKKVYIDENENKTIYAIFSRNGHLVDIPENYSSSKIKFISKAKYNAAIDPTKNYYILYDFLDREIYTNPYKKPVNVDFKRNVITTLFPTSIEVPATEEVDAHTLTTYYAEENYQTKVVEELDFSQYTLIYWYKVNERDNEPKRYNRPVNL